MANKLYKYDGFDPTTNTILNGFELNDAFMWGDETVLSGITGYTDITTIINLETYGDYIGLDCVAFYEELIELYDGVWSGYTTEEKKILAEYFIVDKDKRDEVLTQEEQNKRNHYILYHYLSEDVIDRIGTSIDYFTTPKAIDYKKDLNRRLHPKQTFDDNGFLTEVIYYEKLTISQDAQGFTQYDYSIPVVKYQANYVTGSDGYVQYRTITRTWALMDGTFTNDEKISTKIYDPISSREEAKRRRKNLVNSLLVDVVGLIIMTTPELTTVLEAETDAMSFMHDIEGAISSYYESGTTADADGNPCQLVQQVTAHTYSRLDNFVPGTSDTVTIRAYILSKIQ